MPKVTGHAHTSSAAIYEQNTRRLPCHTRRVTATQHRPYGTSAQLDPLAGAASIAAQSTGAQLFVNHAVLQCIVLRSFLGVVLDALHVALTQLSVILTLGHHHPYLS
jgi:hypothetical protein